MSPTDRDMDKTGSEPDVSGELLEEKAGGATNAASSKDKDRTSLASDPDTFEPPDGGWGWVVCFGSFWTNGTVFGTLNSFGILYVKLLEEYQSGTDDIAFKTSWIGALQISMTFFMSPIASILVNKFGIRATSLAGATIATSGMLASSFVYKLELLYLTYGILLGFGSSLLYTPSIAILCHYFKKRLGIVNGLVSFGSAAFTFVLPFMLKELLSSIGLRHTMRILAGMLGVLFICPFIWKPLLKPVNEPPDYVTSVQSVYIKCCGCKQKLKELFDVSIWKNKGYRIWAIGLPVSFFGYFIPFVHLVKHTNDVFPDANAEILVICIGATSGVSRLICGKLADFPKVNRILMQQFAFFILGIATACIPLAGSFGVLVPIVLLMGICDGCFICLIGPIANDLLGPIAAGQGLGCLFGLMSIPMTVGPPMAGLAYDLMETYKIAFFAAGIPPIVGACILFLVPKEAMHRYRHLDLYSQTKGPMHTTEEVIMTMSNHSLHTLTGSSWTLQNGKYGLPIGVDETTMEVKANKEHTKANTPKEPV